MTTFFESYSRLVSTRKGMFLVTGRKLSGVWETIAMVIRGLIALTGGALAVVVSAFVPEPMDLVVAGLGLAAFVLAALTAVSWRVALTKLLARRIPFIAGKSTQPGAITSITLMED